MKTVIILFIALAATAFAAPQSVPTARYSRLWTDSCFTSKPLSLPITEETNPLDDYALGGISPIPGGHRVTLLNRRKPDERIVLPDNPDFKILSVQYATENPLGATVRVSSGSKTGTVSFDKTLLVLKAAPASPQQHGQSIPVEIQGAETPRAPRSRVTPPAVPSVQQTRP